MAVLSGNVRAHTRATGREAYVDAGGDEKLAIKLGKQRLRESAESIIASLLIGLALRLLVELIKYWFLQNDPCPSMFYVRGEPGFEGYEGDSDDEEDIYCDE